MVVAAAPSAPRMEAPYGRLAQAQELSEWSDRSVVEAGLLNAGDWAGAFISPVGPSGPHMPAPLLRGALDIPGEVRLPRDPRPSPAARRPHPRLCTAPHPLR